MDYKSNSLDETDNIAQKIAKKVLPPKVLALYGDLGSGKTTFTRYLTKHLKVASRVQSPTFVIARKYQATHLKINHIDLYRLLSKEDLVELDLDQFFKDENAINVIEWPEIAEEILPKDTIKIYFKYLGEDSRSINVQNLY